jgi:type II secretory pathway pseudopilin PulG
MNRVQRAEALAGHKPLWARILVPGLVVLAIVVAATGAWFARSSSDASQDVRASAAAAACRASTNSAYSELDSRRDNLYVDANLALADNNRAAVFGPGGFKDQLRVLVDRINALPPRAQAYADGITIEGVRYPACPGSVYPPRSGAR